MNDEDTISEAKRLSLEEWRAWKGFVKRHFGEAQSRAMTNIQLECFVAELRALLATRQPVEAAQRRPDATGDDAPDGSIEFFLGQLAFVAKTSEQWMPATGVSMEDSIEGIRRLVAYERAQRRPATDLTDKLFEYAQACRDAYEFIAQAEQPSEVVEDELMKRLLDLGSFRDKRPLTPQEIEHGRKVAERLGLLTDHGIAGQGEREGGDTP